MRKFKNVLITGISGSGGSYLAEYILSLNKDIKINGTYRKKNKINLQNILGKVKLIKNNLSTVSKIKKMINKLKPDVIFHLASDADVKKSFENPLNQVKKNCEITLNLLEAVRISKHNPFIQMCSTSEVYGNLKKKDMPINENKQLKPNNPYAVSKLFQDTLAQTYNKNFGLNIIITRMFTYLNPRRKNLFASSWAHQINLIKLNKQKFLYHGNLNSTRTIMDVRDAMRAYWLVMEKGEIGEIYNIGSDKAMNLKNFLNMLIKRSKKKIVTKLDKKLLRKSDIAYQIPDSSKFFRATKWKPKISIEKSLDFLLKETNHLI
tara:strand:- start:30 stop:989 length:960 start_codon:yes stop_codon:yes gene_type:complete